MNTETMQNTISPADVLVISAHPDDAEFGAGGTVARWTREGRQVVYVVCTFGEKGTTDYSMDPGKLAEIREHEQRAAAGVLGVRDVIYLGLPDQGLEDTPDFRKRIVREIRTYRPHIVVTSDPYRRYIWHRDHRVIGQVVLDAVFPYARDHLAYADMLEEGLKPHKVREIFFWGADSINCRTDITAVFDLKIEALRQHKSQVTGFKSTNLERWMRKRNREMAEDEDFELAEAFYRVTAPK